MNTPTPTPIPEHDTSVALRRSSRRRLVYAVIACVLILMVLAVAAALGAFSGKNTPGPASQPSNSQLVGVDGAIPRPLSTPVPPPSTAPAAPAFTEPFTAVSPDDPVAVMRAALASMFTYLPGDSTQLDAARRAAPLIAPPGVDDGFMTLAPITGGQWSQWRHDADTVTARVTVPTRGDNPDTATVASRAATVTQRVIDRRGKVIDTLPPMAVYTTARHQSTGQWQISKVTVQ
ncbi:MAG: hypothetical protein INR66_06695 [Gordonia polyisoprenivorans]|nr:hypothetical protein [Gordonia polyisoprenivorans]